MKKKYFTIIFLVFVLLAVILTSDQSIKVVKRIFVLNHMKDQEDKIIIVIDPGHPGT